jgi:zinc transporter ZupT
MRGGRVLGVAVALSIACMAAGPVLVTLGRERGTIHALVDGFVLGLVPPLIVLRILPELCAELGVFAVAFFVTGYAGAWLGGRSSRRMRLVTWLSLGTFALHSIVDGAALALACQSGGRSALALGLVSHRLPEGLLIGTQLLPRFGGWRTVGVTALLGAATALGALSGQRLLAHVDAELTHGLVAVGMGAMLRIASHRHADPLPRRGLALGAFGFLVGAVLAVVVPVASE